jgi:putative nucleotidyltransferase with HDIG domain
MFQFKEKSMSETILFIDKEEHSLNSLEEYFPGVYVKTHFALTAEEALNYLKNEKIAAVFLDSTMSCDGELDLLLKIKETSPDTLRILMTASTDIAKAVDAINRGDLFRYILKPLDMTELNLLLKDAVKRFQLIQLLKSKDEGAMLSVIQEVESRDPYSVGHSENVVRYALMIADAMDLSENIRMDLKRGCRLHDLGKMNIPDKILNKKQPLIKEEYEAIKNHPGWGAALVRQADFSESVLDIVLYHHERYEGSGYPAGISGKDIPLVARIAAVADVYSALTSDRAYRKKHANEKAIDIMLLMKENVFDPEILDVFLYKCLGLSRPCFEVINK